MEPACSVSLSPLVVQDWVKTVLKDTLVTKAYVLLPFLMVQCLSAEACGSPVDRQQPVLQM